MDFTSYLKKSYQGEKYNCEPKCPHLNRSGDTAVCALYGEALDYDISVFGEWYMCEKCIEDTYGTANT